MVIKPQGNLYRNRFQQYIAGSKIKQCKENQKGEIEGTCNKNNKVQKLPWTE
jgi:hypothetical protein